MAKSTADTKTEMEAAYPFAGRIIFVTGRQGAGKTVLANELAAAHGLLHLDGDLWSGQPEVKDSRTALCEFMMKYRDASPGSVADEPEAWQPLTPQCRQRHGNPVACKSRSW